VDPSAIGVLDKEERSADVVDMVVIVDEGELRGIVRVFRCRRHSSPAQWMVF
jgi:hypothetical protein